MSPDPTADPKSQKTDTAGTVYEDKPSLAPGIRRIPKRNWLATIRQIPAEKVFLVSLISLFLLGLVGLALYSMWPAPVAAPAGAEPRALAISPSGSRLLVGLRDGSVRVLEIASSGLRESARAKFGVAVLAVAFGPDDSVLLLVGPGPLDPKAPERTESNPTLVILSPDLKQQKQRLLQPNAHDVLWSSALRTAIVLSGGPDDLHARLEFFSADPVGLASSTPQMRELGTYFRPQRIAITDDGERLAISFASRHRMNVLLYDPRTARAVNALQVSGSPETLSFSKDGGLLVTASPDSETIDVVRPKQIDTIQIPRSSSLSPPRQLVIAPDAMRAYTAGAPTLAEIQFEPQQVIRKAEPPFHSSAIALAPDGKTAYLLYQDRDELGIVDLASGKVRQVPLR